MFKPIYLGILTGAFLLLNLAPIQAESIVERVKKTGVLQVGLRKDVYPFSQFKAKQWQGYSVDIIGLIKTQLEREINKKIEIKYTEVGIDERISKIVREEVDLICGTTSFSWDRAKFVDFSVPFFITGTQLLIKQTSPFQSLTSLEGRQIGIIPKTSNELTVIRKIPNIIVVSFEDIQTGINALSQGEIDAFAWDGILLESVKANQSQPKDYKIIPVPPIDYQGYACMIPKDNSKFRDIVNYSILKLIQGIIDQKDPYKSIFTRWFGKNSGITVDNSYVLNYFKFTLDSYQRLPETEFQ